MNVNRNISNSRNVGAKRAFVALATIVLVASTAAALSFSGKKWYINPGHGGHDSDDRPTTLPMGLTPIFYESDGNLTRGLYVQSLFKAYGGSTKMSRTTNTTADDLALSTIASQSNSYGGYFISLHTNGANASANYTIAFYRGSQSSTNSTEVVSPSKAMGQAVVNEHAAVSLTNTTYSTPRSVSDYATNGYNYGVLRTNSRPGYLIETWFHDYRPEALRLKNDNYNYFLAWQIVRGFCVSPMNSATGLKGAIVGDIRNKDKACGYTNYTTRGRDTYLAVNGAKVVLKNSAGETVASQKTDNFHNGVYFFPELAAGTYTVTVSKSGYVTKSATVTVKKDAVTKKCFNLVEGENVGIKLSASTWSPAATVGASKSKTITVTGTGLTSAITVKSSNSLFTLSTTSIDKAGGTVKVTYKPTAAGSHSAKITFTSGSTTATLAITGTATNPPLTFTEGWNFSENSGKTASWVSDFSKIRNMTFGDGKLYVVSPSNTVYIVNAQTGAKMGELSMNGVTGGSITIMDVEYYKGKIIGCNLAQSSKNDTFKIYCWDNDQADPRLLLETSNYCGKTRIGDCMELESGLASGFLTFAAGSSSEGNTIVKYAITNGVVNPTPTVIDFKDEEGRTVDDSNNPVINLGASPRIVRHSANYYWAMGAKFTPTLFYTADGKAYKVLNPSIFADVGGNSFRRFTYKGTTYAFATDYTAGTTSDERFTGAKMMLIDTSNGWAKAEKVGYYPAAGLGTTRNTYKSTAIEVATNGDEGVEAWFLCHYQGIAYYKTGTPKTWNAALSSPSLSSTTTSLAMTAAIGSAAQKTVSVTGKCLQDDLHFAISGDDAAMFTLNKSSITEYESGVKITYAPTSSGPHSATLIVTSDGATPLSIPITGTVADLPLSFAEIWNYSETSGIMPSWITAFSQIRNMAFGDGKLYVVNPGNAVYIINAQTGEKMGELSMDGISDGVITLLGIKYVNGKILGCNVATDTSAQTYPFKVYCWDNDVAEPRLILETTNYGGKARIGDNIELEGDMHDGYLVFSAGGVNGGSTICKYHIYEGTVDSTPTTFDLKNDQGLAYDASGNPTIVGGHSQHVVNTENGEFWVIGQKIIPLHYDSAGNLLGTINLGLLADIAGNDFRPFEYRGTTYAFATDYTAATEEADRYKDAKMMLIDGSAGWDNATKLAYYPTAGLGTTVNNMQATSIMVDVNGDDGVEAWFLSYKQGIAYYRTGTPKAWNPVILTPTITSPTSAITLQSEDNAVVRSTFDIVGKGLTEGIELSISGESAAMFSLDQSTLPEEGGTVEIIYSPTASGIHNATITATSKGAPTVTIAVTASCQSSEPEPEPEPELDPADFTLTTVMRNTSAIPASDDGMFSTGYDGHLYIFDKSAGIIYSYNSAGARSSFATGLNGYGSAITSDDAGNILIQKEWATAAGSAQWLIIEQNGTRHDLTLAYPSGVEPYRLDASGRIVGNVLSAEGAYWCLLPGSNEAEEIVNEAAAIFHIANGEQVLATTVELDFVTDFTAIAQPLFTTVSEMDANGDSAFAYRLRTNRNTALKALSLAASDGFDVFALGGVTYLVEPAGAEYGDGFVIHEVDSDEILAQKTATMGGDGVQRFQSITARPEADGKSVLIYQNVSGASTAIYRYGINSTGIDGAASQPVMVESIYYNIQGIKITKPAAGQVCIRVSRMSDGSVKTSKIIAK
ncbi:MAG: N-acetylmuramoyl-L-alanine amidase [Muribaculaceae bacterium]|nr:N-acetylmuramoyl-L-alanine amidase [Muribaculaceae bacterium]